jgi:glyoxylase-like metal-dependent hydrolase (beta-lactamase superfamily II)
MRPTSILLIILIELGISLQLFGQVNKPRLAISHLTGDFYVYTTYRLFDGKPVPSNSMYLITDNGAVMFDTPWDTTQFQPLIDSIQLRHHKIVVLCIATHFHDDRTAGLDFLKHKGVKTYSSKLTFDLCKEHNEKQTAYFFTKDTAFTIGNHHFVTYYPGEGHTKDNIVIWFDDEKVLYGGCLVKSTAANDLGYLGDANLSEWPATVTNVMNRFPKPLYVIPGHFGWANNKGLEHTLQLLEEHEKKNNQ